MRWTPDVHCGFCAPDVAPWLPVPESERAVNVETQDGDPNSMLTLYRSLIALRRSEPALTSGGYTPVRAADGVLAYRRDNVLVALNLTGEPRSLPAGGVVRVGTHADRVGQRIGPTLTLRPDEGVVL
jgi:alpha-glucosidase